MSQLFAPFRAIGDVCSPTCPVVLRRLGGVKTFATVALGRSFVVYDCEHFRVALVSRPMPDAVTALCAGGSHTTFAAAGGVIYRFERNASVLDMRAPEDATARISHLVNFGTDIIVSMDVDGRLRAWDANTGALTMECDVGRGFDARALLHPSTYLNKVLVGGAGGLQLWNFNSGKQLHVFQRFENVHSLAQSPAVDVVAVGLGSGRVVLLNIRLDAELFALSDTGAVTALAFGHANGAAILATGSSAGHVCLWSLEERRLQVAKRGAHRAAAVFSVAFMPGGQPELLTAGAENALRLWSLEDNGRLELVKSREGHGAPPTTVRFHPGGSIIASLASGADGRALQMLTSGPDGSLRVMHALLDHQSRVFSHKTARLFDGDLPAVAAFATSEAREKDWCNVVSAHRGQATARAWSFEKGALGVNGGALAVRSKGFAVVGGGSKRKRGANDADAAAQPTCVALSACGSFAVVGLATGLCVKYNLQSGAPRGCFPAQVWPKADKRRKRTLPPAGSVYATTKEPTPQERAATCEDAHARHDGAVVGVALDLLGTRLYSAGVDGVLVAWDFASHTRLRALTISTAPVSKLAASRDGALLVLASDDLALRVVDAASMTVVRCFAHAHRAAVADVCFSADARWVVSACADGAVKVWDVPSARCVDWLAFEQAVTSVSVSATGDYMATTHVDSTAVHLWASRLRFEPDLAAVPCSAPCRMQLQGALTEDDDSSSKDALAANDDDDEESPPLEAADNGAQVCLTETPDKWFSLAHLDVVRLRNQPVRPPDKPEAAPFFLPVSASDLDSGALAPAERGPGGPGNDAKVRIGKPASSRLHAALLHGDWAGASALVEASGAAAVDFEVLTSSQGDDDEAGNALLRAWLDWAAHELQGGRRFELVQAVLARLLLAHGDQCASPRLKDALLRVKDVHARAWGALDEALSRALCLVEYDLRVT